MHTHTHIRTRTQAVQLLEDTWLRDLPAEEVQDTLTFVFREADKDGNGKVGLIAFPAQPVISNRTGERVSEAWDVSFFLHSQSNSQTTCLIMPSQCNA